MYILPICTAVIAQLGERKTEDLKVSGSIPDCGIGFASGPLRDTDVTYIAMKKWEIELTYFNQRKLILNQYNNNPSNATSMK